MTGSEVETKERRRIALQIQAVVHPYRVELKRNDPEVMAAFRMRAHVLLDMLDAVVKPHDDLLRALASARAELSWG